MLLGDIAEIKTGLVLARKKAEVEFQIKQKYKLLTVKNIENDGSFNGEAYEEFKSNDELDTQYFTQKGDVLIRLSHPNTAVYISDEQQNLLVPSYFAIIKLNSKDFLPQYIAWYLNTDRIRNELIRSQSGSYIPSTNKNVLSSLNIKKLSLEEQSKVVEVQGLYIREKELLNELINEKEKFYKAITNRIIKGKNNGGEKYGQ